MSLEYIRKYYGVPAKRGGIVEVREQGGAWVKGKILSGTHNLKIKIDSRNVALRYHPESIDLRYLKEVSHEK